MCNPVETKYQCGQCIVNGGQHKDIVVVGASYDQGGQSCKANRGDFIGFIETGQRCEIV